MELTAVRVVLLAGLIFHKAVWEVLKRQDTRQRPAASKAPLPVRAAKIAVLAGIIIQTLSPEILPISNDTSITLPLGLILFAAGLLLAVIARLQLGKQWSDIEVGSVAGDHKLIDRGVYGLIRHPIYTGDLLLLTGLELALNSWLVLGVLALLVAVWRKVDQEEARLAAQLPSYRAYQQRTKRFVPFVV